MKFTLAIAVAFVAGAMAHGDQPYPAGNATVTTQTVTAYTTYCPSPTTFAHGGTTYTVTEATTLTITPSDCACTKTPSAPGSGSGSYGVPPVPTTPVAATTLTSAAPYGNGTAVGPTSGVASSTGAAATTSITPYQGAASRNVAGAGVIGLVALAMMAL